MDRIEGSVNHCMDYTCPYLNSFGYCSLTACVRHPGTYSTNRTETMYSDSSEIDIICPHCGERIRYTRRDIQT